MLSVCLSVRLFFLQFQPNGLTKSHAVFFVDTVILASSAVCIFDYAPNSGTLRNPGFSRFLIQKMHIKAFTDKICIEYGVVDDGESESEVSFSLVLLK